MNAREIEKFFNDYKHGISTISHLEQQLLKESYSYDKWYDTMKLKSKTLRDIYAQNVSDYDNIIKNVTENEDFLTDEICHHLLTHIDFFLSEGFRDYGVTVPVLKVLIPYWEKQGIKGKILDSNFFYGIALGNSHYYGEACNAFSRALAQYDDIMDCEEPYWMFRMLCGAYYRLLNFVALQRYSEEVLIEYYNYAHKLWNDERVPEWIVSKKKRIAINSIMRNLVISVIDRMLDNNIVPTERLFNILKEEADYQNSRNNGRERLVSAEAVWYKYLRAAGKISIAEYEKRLRQIGESVSKGMEARYSYGTWEFTALFDDETPDEVFEADKLFFMNPSYAYVRYVLSELLTLTTDSEIKDMTCRGIYRYFTELPHLAGDGYPDTILYPLLAVFVARCEDEDMIVDCILNLFVHRQISTAIHVTMVAKLSECIVRHMAKAHPEYFLGCLDLNSYQDIFDNVDKLGEFAYKAGIIHDIGKMVCTDVVTLQNRKILGEEFARIKTHPAAGASVLLGSESLFEYSFIALCHHLFDDGSRGYPEGVQIPNDPSRIFIEMVTVCDSIDAMSDTLGRNYANPKTIDVIIEELCAEKGTRYSERVVNMLTESPELIEEIKKLLYEERVNVNYDVYRKFIMPDIRFRPEDEKYISAISDGDVSEVLAMLPSVDFNQWIDMYEKCKNNGYVIRDGYNNLYGFVLCEPVEENLFIRQIFVKEKERRNGYGSLLVRYAENVAREYGYSRICMMEVVKGHFDKFGWHNGYFEKMDNMEGWMAKKI